MLYVAYCVITGIQHSTCKLRREIRQWRVTTYVWRDKNCIVKNQQVKQEQKKKRKSIKKENKIESFRTFLRGVCRCFQDNENGNKNLYAEPPVPVDKRRVTFLLPKKKKSVWRERLGLRSGVRWTKKKGIRKWLICCVNSINSMMM